MSLINNYIVLCIITYRETRLWQGRFASWDRLHPLVQRTMTTNHLVLSFYSLKAVACVKFEINNERTWYINNTCIYTFLFYYHIVLKVTIHFISKTIWFVYYMKNNLDRLNKSISVVFNHKSLRLLFIYNKQTNIRNADIICHLYHKECH